MNVPARHLSSPPQLWARRRCTLRVAPSTPQPAREREFQIEALREVGIRWARALGEPPEALQLHVHRFEPQGLSVLVVLPGLRGVLHTWPERGLATLDLTGAEDVRLARRVTEIAGALGMELAASST